MIPKFKVGDFVEIDILALSGKIVKIEGATEKLKNLIGIKEDLILYKVEISREVSITITEDSLTKLEIGRAQEDNMPQNFNT